uniref:Mitogen-activated protein kinase kinase kinase n=1 Tax=Rhabditophanes sp. KR3021 TaxID=114890 RepID=A0AC35UG05_9BILA
MSPKPHGDNYVNITSAQTSPTSENVSIPDQNSKPSTPVRRRAPSPPKKESSASVSSSSGEADSFEECPAVAWRNSTNSNTTKDAETYIVVHEYAGGHKNDLNIKRGSTVRVRALEKNKNWLVAECDDDIGYIPKNYVAKVDYELIHESSITDLGVIANGSFGTISKAIYSTKSDRMNVQGTHNRNVAYKTVKSSWTRPSFQQTLDDEANILSLLKHKNIIKLYGVTFNETSPRIGLVLEWCAGETLDKLIYSYKGDIKTVNQMNILIQLAEGMQYIHSESKCKALLTSIKEEPSYQGSSYIHRDLKPANILIKEKICYCSVTAHWHGKSCRKCTGCFDISDITVKIADFGLSKANEDTDKTVKGTAGYAAPENYNGICVKESDVFSFTIIMWELIKREKPFDQKKPQEIISMMYNLKVDELILPLPPCHSKIQELIRAGVNKCIEKRPMFKEIVEILKEHREFAKERMPSSPSGENKRITKNSSANNDVQLRTRESTPKTPTRTNGFNLHTEYYETLRRITKNTIDEEKPVVPKRAGVKKHSDTKITKDMIGLPSDFVHKNHLGTNEIVPTLDLRNAEHTKVLHKMHTPSLESPDRPHLRHQRSLSSDSKASFVRGYSDHSISSNISQELKRQAAVRNIKDGAFTPTSSINNHRGHDENYVFDDCIDSISSGELESISPNISNTGSTPDLHTPHKPKSSTLGRTIKHIFKKKMSDVSGRMNLSENQSTFYVVDPSERPNTLKPAAKSPNNRVVREAHSCQPGVNLHNTNPDYIPKSNRSNGHTRHHSETLILETPGSSKVSPYHTLSTTPGPSKLSPNFALSPTPTQQFQTLIRNVEYVSPIADELQRSPKLAVKTQKVPLMSPTVPKHSTAKTTIVNASYVHLTAGGEKENQSNKKEGKSKSGTPKTPDFNLNTLSIDDSYATFTTAPLEGRVNNGNGSVEDGVEKTAPPLPPHTPRQNSVPLTPVIPITLSKLGANKHRNHVNKQ